MDQIKHIDLCIGDGDDEETQRCSSLDAFLKTLSNFDEILLDSESFKKLILFAAVEGCRSLGRLDDTSELLAARVLEKWRDSL